MLSTYWKQISVELIIIIPDGSFSSLPTSGFLDKSYGVFLSLFLMFFKAPKIRNQDLNLERKEETNLSQNVLFFESLLYQVVTLHSFYLFRYTLLNIFIYVVHFYNF